MTFEEAILIAFLTATMTLFFNSIFHSLKNKLDWFVDKKKFKREHNYKQLTELYLYLYGIIAQSEYIRFFEWEFTGNLFDRKDIPFLELNSKKTTVKFEEGKVVRRETEIHNEITDENKLKLVSKILDKREYASQKLLKLAVAYRICHKYYLEDIHDVNRKNLFQEQEVKLIYEIVRTVILECNNMLEICNMDFDGIECTEGLMNYKEIMK